MPQPDLNQLRREISAKYNLDLDHELVPLMAELIESSRKVEHMEKTMEATALMLKKKQNSFAQYTYQSNWQAFWHGFGSIGLPATLAVMCILIAYMLWFDRAEAAQNARQIQTFLNEHRQIAAFQDLSDYQVVQDMEIGDYTLQYIQMPVVNTIRQAQPGKNVVVEFKKDNNGKTTDAVIKIPLRVINK